MRAIRLFLIASIFIIFAFSCSYADNYNLQVKELRESPELSSKVTYQIPIEVKMLDMTEDANWYKVGIKFSLGLVELKYSGWAYIPVGDLLVEKQNKASTSQ